MFKQAARKGKLLELDLAAQKSAIRGFSVFSNGISLFINTHPKSFENGLKIDLSETSLSPSQIVIEITEHQSINIDAALHSVNDLKANGIRFAIDDFGKGYANFNLLELLEPDYIKLDKSLIRSYRHKNAFILLRGLQRLADDMGIDVIAEGIETPEQMEFVQSCGIQYGQGWYIGMPTVQNC